MAANFLHGVETIELTSGAVPVRGVKTAVIGLVGTAPIQHVLAANRTVDVVTRVAGPVDAARYFGPASVDGYSIPKALEAIFAQGVGTVLVVNVFDPDTHKTAVAEAERTITAGIITLPQGDLTALTVSLTSGGAALVEGTDYTVDRVTGIITVVAGGALAAASSAFVAHSYGNPSAVVAADIIGAVDGTTGARSGMQAWLDSMNQFGFNPKILCAPAYSTQASVVAAMGVLAAQDKLRAVYLVDAPAGTTVAEAIAGRGTDGEINFEVSDDRCYLLFPHLSAYNAATDAAENRPYSQFMSGVIAATDQELGFWNSPSNKVIKGILGTEVPVTAAINDPTCEANQLNEVGITTVFNAFGTGFRTWGNRSAAFPASSAIGTFLKARRVADQIHESIELAMLPFIDQDLNDTIIKAVEQSANDYVRTLIARKALVSGSRVFFNPEKNPASEIALGHAIWDIEYCAFPPAERLTFEALVNTNLLAQG